jgi:hypothetical protein
MRRVVLAVAVLAAIACSSRAPARTAPSAAPAGAPYDRIPDRVGDFALTERTSVVGLPSDSVFRFSDGSDTRLTVIVYDPEEGATDGPDPQVATAEEGAKFPITQEVRRSRGQITGFVVAFSDTARVAGGRRPLLEHSVAVPVRLRNGTIAVELQYLYLIDGKFVKVRATESEQRWQQTKARAFARELVRRLDR